MVEKTESKPKSATKAKATTEEKVIDEFTFKLNITEEKVIFSIGSTKLGEYDRNYDEPDYMFKMEKDKVISRAVNDKYHVITLLRRYIRNNF